MPEEESKGLRVVSIALPLTPFEAESFTELTACCLLTSWQRAPLVAGSGAITGFQCGGWGSELRSLPAEPSPKALFLSSLARTFLLSPIYLML